MSLSHLKGLWLTTTNEISRNTLDFFICLKSPRKFEKHFLANLCKIVDIQVPLWSHFLNLIVCSYFLTKCFSETCILILQPKCSSGDPWTFSLAVLWPEKTPPKIYYFHENLAIFTQKVCSTCTSKTDFSHQLHRMEKEVGVKG